MADHDRQPQPGVSGDAFPDAEAMDFFELLRRLEGGGRFFGRGTEITLEVDEAVLAGNSVLLLPALLSRLFARYAAVNAFVQTRTKLLHGQEEVPWPITLGNRSLV